MSEFLDEIPGGTPVDISHLTAKAKKLVKNQEDLNRLEAENIRNAVIKYLAAKPRTPGFNVTWVCTVHRDMFVDVWRWAGEIRQENLNIGAPFHSVRSDLHAILEDLHSWSEYGWPLSEQAVHLHHRAVKIHPFLNGNGRWSRLIANILLRHNDHPIIAWPATMGQRSEIRDEYIRAIKLADEGEYSPLTEIHERYSKAL